MDLGSSGPASTLSLTLIFLMSDNIKAASLFCLPTNTSSEDQGKEKGGMSTRAFFTQPPHLVGLRVLGRALVLWSSIRPSREWIEEQLPLEARVRHITPLNTS